VHPAGDVHPREPIMAATWAMYMAKQASCMFTGHKHWKSEHVLLPQWCLSSARSIFSCNLRESGTTAATSNITFSICSCSCDVMNYLIGADVGRVHNMCMGAVPALCTPGAVSEGCTADLPQGQQSS